MIKPEYKNIPDTEFVPLTENEVRKDLAGLYEINKKGEVRNVKTKRILKIEKSNFYPRVHFYKKKYSGKLSCSCFISKKNLFLMIILTKKYMSII